MVQATSRSEASQKLYIGFKSTEARVIDEKIMDGQTLPRIVLDL